MSQTKAIPSVMTWDPLEVCVHICRLNNKVKFKFKFNLVKYGLFQIIDNNI